MTLKEEIMQLENTGSSSAIANVIAKEKITGEIACGWRCVLANYLTRKVGMDVLVGTMTIVTFAADGVTKTEVALATFPNVYGFIVEFDSGMYPNLVESI